MKKIFFYLFFYYFVSVFLLVASVWGETPEPTVTLFAEEVWQRQQLIMTVAVETKDPFAKLRIDAFKQEGLEIVPLAKEKVEINKDGITHYILSKKWAVFPFIAGEQMIHPPRIRYHPNRGSLKTLKVSDLPLKVRPLPIYVPPTMPVGTIKLKSSWNEGLLISTKNLVQWQLTVTGAGVAKQTLPSISRQLTTTHSYDVLPVQHETKIIAIEQGIAYQRMLTFPLKATQSGRLSLPIITVQYFEPSSGKLQIAQLKPPFVIAMNKWVTRLLGLIALAISISLLLFVSYKIKSYLRKRVQYHQALSLLKEADTYQQIRTALNQLALTQGWHENLTLSEFSVLWEREYGARSGIEAEINKLLQYQFAQKKKAEVKLIAQSLLNKIKGKAWNFLLKSR